MTSNREKLVEVVVDTIWINATAQRHPYDAAFAILNAINAAGFEIAPKLNSKRERMHAARDAALEEAAKVAEAVDPEKPANWLHARHKIAFEIRALRAMAQEIDDER